MPEKENVFKTEFAPPGTVFSPTERIPGSSVISVMHAINGSIEHYSMLMSTEQLCEVIAATDEQWDRISKRLETERDSVLTMIWEISLRAILFGENPSGQESANYIDAFLASAFTVQTKETREAIRAAAREGKNFGLSFMFGLSDPVWIVFEPPLDPSTGAPVDNTPTIN